MLETEEQIQTTLNLTGTLMSFEAFDILGVLSFHTERLYSQEITNYIVEQQDWVVHCSTYDCVRNEISEDDEFTIEDLTYMYTFRLNSKPIPYADGWSRLRLNLISKVEL